MSMLGYQRYEYGAREPSFQKLIALADYFGAASTTQRYSLPWALWMVWA